jgi:histidinol-phosphate aminotransferase
MTASQPLRSQTIPKHFIQDLPTPGWPPIQRDVAGGRDPATIRRMNLNESPFPPSPRAIAAMQEAVTRVNYYPDPKWRDLTAALSAHIGHPQDQIVMGCGSDELIVSVGRFCLSPDDEVVVGNPSFGSYNKAAQVNGAKVVAVPVRQDGACDVQGMAEAVTDRTRLVFLATPNNPTGGMLGTEDVIRLAKALPDDVLLVLDEAYYEYGIHAGGDDHLKALAAARSGPWVSFRTFSKAYGLAGMRVGYGLCNTVELADTFQKMRSVFNVNAVAQAGALAALGDLDHMRSILERTRIERERIAAGLIRLGCEPYPSVGNFLAAKTPKPAAAVVEAMLADYGVLIGRLMIPGFEDYIRITTATSDDTDVLLAGLEAVLA